MSRYDDVYLESIIYIAEYLENKMSYEVTLSLLQDLGYTYNDAATLIAEYDLKRVSKDD